MYLCVYVPKHSCAVLYMCVRAEAGRCRATRCSANSPRPISCNLSPLSSSALPCRPTPSHSPSPRRHNTASTSRPRMEVLMCLTIKSQHRNR